MGDKNTPILYPQLGSVILALCFFHFVLIIFIIVIICFLASLLFF